MLAIYCNTFGGGSVIQDHFINLLLLKRRIGPNTVPCGTPPLTDLHSETCSFKLTPCFLFFTDIYCTDISGPCELSQRQEILKDTVTLKWCTIPKASSNIGKVESNQSLYKRLIYCNSPYMVYRSTVSSLFMANICRRAHPGGTQPRTQGFCACGKNTI